MSGNIWEWNDLTGAAGSTRQLRGGYWSSFSAFALSSAGSNDLDPSTEEFGFGFRLASVAVPEPSTWVMAAGGLACAGWCAGRRRRAR
jgi:hypothetical protein